MSPRAPVDIERQLLAMGQVWCPQAFAVRYFLRPDHPRFFGNCRFLAHSIARALEKRPNQAPYAGVSVTLNALTADLDRTRGSVLAETLLSEQQAFLRCLKGLSHALWLDLFHQMVIVESGNCLGFDADFVVWMRRWGFTMVPSAKTSSDLCKHREPQLPHRLRKFQQNFPPLAELASRLRPCFDLPAIPSSPEQIFQGLADKICPSRPNHAPESVFPQTTSDPSEPAT